jgi:hypothetical protein
MLYFQRNPPTEPIPPLLHPTQWMVGKALHTMSLLKAILLVKQVNQHIDGWMDGWIAGG